MQYFVNHKHNTSEFGVICDNKYQTSLLGWWATLLRAISRKQVRKTIQITIYTVENECIILRSVYSRHNIGVFGAICHNLNSYHNLLCEWRVTVLTMFALLYCSMLWLRARRYQYDLLNWLYAVKVPIPYNGHTETQLTCMNMTTTYEGYMP